MTIETTFTLGASWEGVGSKVAVIPILDVERGRLIDNLHFLDNDAKRISSLTHAESAAYILLAFKRYLGAMPARAALLHTVLPNMNETVGDALYEVLGSRAASEDMAPAAREIHGHRIDGLLATILGFRELSPDEQLQLAQAVRALANNYWVCIRVIKPTGEMRVKMSRSLVRGSLQQTWRNIISTAFPVLITIPGGGLRRTLVILGVRVVAILRELRSIRRVFTALRMLLRKSYSTVQHLVGVRTPFVAHSLDMGPRAQTYHLNLRGPEGTYAARQQFTASTGIPVEAATLNPLTYNLTLPRGQRQAHLYLRGANSNTLPDFFQATFYERTPGSLAVAAVLTGVTLAVALVLAVAQLDAYASACTSVDADLVRACQANLVPSVPNETNGLAQILLAFPLAAGAAVVGFSKDRSNGGVFAKLASVISIGGALIALLISSLPERFSLSGTYQAWALSLLVLSAFFIASLALWLQRAAVHHHYLFVED